MTGLVLDAGALIALEQGDRAVATDLRVARAEGQFVCTTSMVLAQVWRGGSGRQARMARLLHHVEVMSIDADHGRRTGELLGATGMADAVDASLVLVAKDGDHILTSDLADIQRLADAAGRRVTVVGC
jgi:hypothetical protein